MPKILLLVLLTALQQPTSTIDSLEQQLTSSEGKAKVIVLNELYKQYINNDPIKALSYTQQALELATELDDASGMASSYNNLGVLNKNRGDYDKALEYYMKSVRLQEEHKFNDALPYTYNNIGTIYSLKSEYPKALEYFNKALVQFESINHKLRVIGTLNNIGNVYSEMGDQEKALENYLKSLTIYEELDDNSQAFVPFSNIGNIYFQKGEWDNAMAFYESALDLERLKNDKNGMANALHNIGSVYKRTGKYDLAMEKFNEALGLVQETNNKRLIEIIYGSMAETYFSSGDLFLAYSFLQLRNNAKDELFSEESSRRIAELENSYEIEKKQSEIESLKIQSDLQQLRIKNDKIIIISAVIVFLIVVGLSLVIFRELRTIKKTKRLLESQNVELEAQKLIIEEKNENITESIDYAKSVQKSLLQFNAPAEVENDFFILFKPKDIVSGDFFWYSKVDDKHIVAAIDCTGHGVAGAFMTVIGHSSLDQIINREQVSKPSDILYQLDEQVSGSINQANKVTSSHGMDVALCSIDKKNSKLRFSGANRPLYYFKNNELNTIKGTKCPIGDVETEEIQFEEHEIDLTPGDMFYLFSDGYADQFGGPNNKKFMISNFKKLLTEIHTLDLKAQRTILKETLAKWQTDTEQTDDILVIGFRV